MRPHRRAPLPFRPRHTGPMSDRVPDAPPHAHRPAEAGTPQPADTPPPRRPRLGWTPERRTVTGAWRSRDVLRAGALILALYYCLRLLWSANQLVLVIFLGILFGLAVSSGVDWLQGRGLRRIPRGVLAALIVFGVIGSLVGFFAWSGPTLATQLGELRTRLPEALDEIESWLTERQGGMLAGVILGGTTPAAGNGPDTLIVTPLPGPTGAGQPPGVAATPLPAPAPVSPPAPVRDSPARAESLAVAAAVLSDTLGTLDSATIALIREQARAAIAADSTPPMVDEPAAPPVAPPAAAAAAALGTGGGTIAVLVPGQRGDSAQAAAPPGLRDRAMAQLSGATRYFFPFLTSTFAVIAGIFLIIFLSIYVAADPRTYRNGIMHLFPLHARNRADEVLEAIATVLRKWLVTQMIAMVVIGTVTTIVLTILGVKGALPLGIIAGLLEFIPNIGPLLAAIPAVAMGFVDSPDKALYVALAYWGIQFLENQLLIPLLMQEGVDLPPAVTLLAQAMLAIVFGFLGLFVAVPLVAVAMVVIRMLYVEGVVGEHMDVIEDNDELTSATGGI